MAVSAFNKVNDYERFFSEEAIRTNEAVLRKIGQLGLQCSGETVNLGGGMPNGELFPFEEASFTLKDGTQIHISPTMMKEALQHDSLLAHIRHLTDRLHGPQNWKTTSILATLGTQHALSVAFDMLVNENDYIIVPDATYSSALSIFEVRNPRYLSIPSDSEGIVPAELRRALAPWNPKECRHIYEDVPKIMYLNPIGNNPNGTTMTTQRKQDIYQIASQYNILILEDDPYYFMSYLEDEFPTSLLSMDIDGRVLHLGSFSKIISAGIRLGYMIGPSDLVAKISMKTTKSVIHAPIIAQVKYREAFIHCRSFWKNQIHSDYDELRRALDCSRLVRHFHMMVSGLLDAWGYDRFLEHARTVRQYYRNRRDMLVAAAERHLKGLCEWEIPQGGLFMWLKVIGVEDTSEMVVRGVKKNIILAPGDAFSPCHTQKNCIRLAFSLASPDQFEKGMNNLARLITEERQVQQ